MYNEGTVHSFISFVKIVILNVAMTLSIMTLNTKTFSMKRICITIKTRHSVETKRNAERCNAECHAFHCYTVCHSAECHHAECRYTESRGAIFKRQNVMDKFVYFSP